MLDLDNKEHVRCLRETAALFSDLTPEQRETWLEKLRRDCALSEHGPVEVLAAAEALADPAKAAELIRRLVEMAGAVVSIERREAIMSIDINRGTYTTSWCIHVDECPPIIARLLALVPGAGANAVLAALRG